MAIGIYKRGQGKYTRLCTAFAAVTMVVLGCLQLYRRLDATDLSLWPKTMIPAGIFVVLAVLVYWLVNKPSIADFMVAAEGEMKKVSWSSRREIAVSTFIVILVVALMATLLWATDLTFRTFFIWLLGY